MQLRGPDVRAFWRAADCGDAGRDSAPNGEGVKRACRKLQEQGILEPASLLRRTFALTVEW